jgi:hypothetical protein
MAAREPDPPEYTAGIRVHLTRNGLWLHVLHDDGHLDLEFIPATALRRLASGGWKEPEL